MTVLTSHEAERRLAALDHSIAAFESRRGRLSQDELWALGRLRLRHKSLLQLLIRRRTEVGKKIVSLELWRHGRVAAAAPVTVLHR